MEPQTPSSSQNPLLSDDFAIPFDKVRAEHIAPAITELITHAQQRIDHIGQSAEPRTFNNTLLALDQSLEKLGRARSVISHLNGVATSPEFRDAYNAAQAPLTQFYSGITLNEALWKAIKTFSQTPEAKSLTGIQKRLLDKTLADFRREGADLSSEDKIKLTEIDLQLSEITNTFNDNILDSTNDYEYIVADSNDLTGLPPSAIDAARASAESKGYVGKWRFTLQAPSFNAVMLHLDNACIREQLYKAYNNRATEEHRNNAPIAQKIIELRKARAKLLGFATFADLVLEDRMAKRGDTAMKFLRDLAEKVRPQADRENRELLEFRRSIEGADAPSMEAWDVAYYAEKQRKQQYDFDEEILKPYFSAEKVMQGMFEVAHRLFDINVTKITTLPTWHSEVTTYAIHDHTNTLIGCFYVDLYPRESKRAGAWMDNFITGKPVQGGFEPHSGMMCANFTPPIGDKPALITHSEVETLFHEFGHLLHHCLSTVELRSLAGINVAWDFVELPSQIMENWCWELEALDLFGRHYQSGEGIPRELFNKMLNARNFRSANATIRQIGMATLDLLIHTTYDREKDGDIVSYSRTIMQQYAAAQLPQDYAFILGFQHIFGGPVGYAAGYYSYKWAEALDADAFTRFKREGIFNRETGLALRNEVFSRGNSSDAAELFKNFMGRDPDLNALLERAGLSEVN